MNRARWLALMLLVVTGVTPAAAQPRTPVSLLLNFYASVEHVPFAYGVVKGTYAEAGLDLTITQGAGSGATVAAVMADSARFGYADVGAIARAISKDAPVRVIAVYVQTSPFAIIFFADRGFRTVRDLVGKKVSFTAGDALHQAWPALLKVNGLERTQIQEVLLAPAAKQAALVAGVVDAMAGYYTTQAGAVEREARRRVGYLRYADFGVNPLSVGLFVHTRHLADRAVNCRMVRATTLAAQAAARDVDGAVEALHQLFPKVNGGARDLTRQQWLMLRELYHTANSRGRPPGYTVRSDWEALIRLLTEYGGMDRARPPEDYYTNEFFECL